MWDLIVSVPDHCLSFYFTKYACTCPIAKKGKTVYVLDDRELKMTVGYGIKGSRNSETVSHTFRNAFQCFLENSNLLLFYKYSSARRFSLV